MKKAPDSPDRETSLSAFNAELLHLLHHCNEKLGFQANNTRGLTPTLADWVMQQGSRQPMPMRQYFRPVMRAALPTRKDNGQPPELAEFLLTMFARTCHTEAMIGDLKECFTRECEEFGRDRAVRLYWARALHSLWPLLWRAAIKALKWSAVIDSVWRRLF